MQIPPSIERAGRWLLHSGIQEPSGGFSRYFEGDAGANKPISTEISGYAASALIYLFRVTGDEEYLEAGRRTARFLIDEIWSPHASLFTFEQHSNLAYFFDSGIIIRGLLAVWRVTREDQLLDVALAAGHGMSAFRNGDEFDPVVELPGRNPAVRTLQWSRGPGCYQAKSVLAWWELGEITQDRKWQEAHLEAVHMAIRTHHTFLAEARDGHALVDRLHAYCYFLEALTPLLATSYCAAAYAQAMEQISRELRNTAAGFSRADVYAQLLRARINGASAVPADKAAAREEAVALAGFQDAGADRRLQGGFLFGQRGGKMSRHASPVPTTFAIQALVMWEAFQTGAIDPCPQLPI